jgi:hypothetical protein
MLSSQKILINSGAALIFFAACCLAMMNQLSKSEAHATIYPNAELEIQSLNQVEEINSDHFKTYEIAPSQND